MSGLGVRAALVDVPTADGVADSYLAQPEDGRRHPGVLFFMDGIGLRPRLHDMADHLASYGYVVLVPNLSYRHGRAPLLSNLPELLTGDRAVMMAALRPFMSALTPDLVMPDVAAYLDFLAAVAPGPVGSTGYCMGGALSLRTAATFPDRVAAAASFHGGNLASDKPDSPHLLVDRIRAELYIAHADQDASMPVEQIERLDDALQATDVRYQAELYAGARHGFTMADTTMYDAAATERHWAALLGLLDRALPQPG